MRKLGLFLGRTNQITLDNMPCGKRLGNLLVSHAGKPFHFSVFAENHGFLHPAVVLFAPPLVRTIAGGVLQQNCAALEEHAGALNAGFRQLILLQKIQKARNQGKIAHGKEDVPEAFQENSGYKQHKTAAPGGEQFRICTVDHAAGLFPVRQIGNGAENVAYEGQAAQGKCDGFEHSKSPLNLEYSYFI